MKNNSVTENSVNNIPAQEDYQVLPTNTTIKKPFNVLPIVGGLVCLLIAGTVGYYFGSRNTSTNQNNGLQQKILLPTPVSTPDTIEQTAISDVPETYPEQKTTKPNSSPQPPVIPSDWKKYSLRDFQTNVSVTLSLPSGYMLQLDSGGGAFMIANESDSTELWEYTTSVFNGKDGLKNYYTGDSRRTWYKAYLDKDFMSEKPLGFKPSTISNVIEKPAGSSTYLELTVNGDPPVTYTDKVEKHYIYVQNNMIHMIRPSSFKANSSDAVIPTHIGTIFASLSATK